MCTRVKNNVLSDCEVFLDIVEFLPDATFAIDCGGEVIAWNKAMEEITGIPKWNVIGTKYNTVAVFFYKEQRPLLIDLVLSDHKEAESFYKYFDRKGDVIYAESYSPSVYNGQGAYLWAKASPLYDKNGNVIGAVETIRDVTDLKLANEALRASESKYRQLVEDINDVIYELDRDGIVTYISPSVQEIAGYVPEEIINNNFAVFIHSDDRQRLIDEYQDILSDHVWEPGKEFRIITATGDHKWAQISVRPVIDENQVVGLRGVLRDISKYKQAEESLRLSDEKYRELVNTTVDGVISVDSDMKIILWNPGAEKLFGYAEQEIMGQSLLKIVPGRYRNVKEDGFAEFSKNGTGLVVFKTFELYGLRRDGSEFPLELSVSSRKMGTTHVATAILRDITDRKQKEKTIRESEERYRQLVDLSPDAIGVTNSEGVFVFVNDAAVKLMAAKSPDDIVGKSFFTFLYPDFHVGGKKLLARLTDKKIGFPLTETRLIRLDGETIDVEMAATPMTYKGEASVQAVVRDITERKRKEKALRESEERYRILTEHVADGVALTRNGKLLFVNQSFVSMFGIAPSQDIIGKSTLDLVVDEYRKGFVELMEGLENGINTHSMFQVKCRTVDNREFWAEGYHNIIQWDGAQVILSNFRDVTERKLHELFEEEERDRLQKENIRLRTSIKDRYRLGRIIGKSPAMQAVYEIIHRAAASDANVIIYGESGTGKELVAHAIHDMSDRNDSEFVPVNCGAIPENLLESEFFGHKKGAFTGAHMDKHGYLDIAEGGSLFLDEIGELGLNIQVKLLRAVEGGGYTPLGSTQVRKSNIRIIAATNRDLMDQVRKGMMREDLFYRIHIIPIRVPALRARREDIPLLIEHFLKLYGKENSTTAIPGKIMDALYKYDWPGNVRELQNVLHRYLTIGTLDFMPSISVSPVENNIFSDREKEPINMSDLNSAIENYERSLIMKTLDQCQWHRNKAASVLGISRNTLFRKMKNHELI
ncbi:MAG: PAS domain S-box protein [Deltaproteobacteria bacterium]|nr:PAS domain S-box protein [Deltaproteobacteria bacterium]